MKKTDYKLRDLVDIPALGQMLDTLYNIAGIPSAIIDMEGNILTGAGWQRVCTDFFRQNPDAEEKCIQSDIHISEEIRSGKPYVIYECPHGLIDSSSPVIVEGQHIANVFTGQMLHAPLTDEAIDHFKSLVKQYGFIEKDFLAALSEVPVYPLKKHKLILDFLTQFAEQAAKMGVIRLKNIEQSRITEVNETRFRLLMDSIDALVYVADMNTYELLFINRFGRDIFGDITGKLCWQTMQAEQTGPCGFCTNKYLLDSNGDPGNVYTWEFQNMVSGQWYYMHDKAIEWTDGRIVRLEIATDITEKKKAEEELTIHTEELERLNKAFVGREIKMKELKEEIKELKRKVKG